MAQLIAAEAQYRDWMLAGLGGDRAAYSRLLAQLSGNLRAYFAKRIGADAEDLVQDTLIAIHTKRATYDPDLPFTAWVHGIARYKLIDAWRRDRRRALVALEDVPDIFAHDAAEAAGAKRDVEKLLAKLPAQKRDLVRAVKLEGRSIAEQAEATGLSETVVKVTVHRAVKSLGRELGDRGEN
ncbi:MAG TPA: sigma-70 family RNA polymerase sigma factor [Rhizomicrobium sp.]|nr:sigma-70 family RNA polymerase sigma factor [Rhizomicrobium sp.]